MIYCTSICYSRIYTYQLFILIKTIYWMEAICP
nr:MAG TPA: hypothetical protein [Caudoviricetes sp.]